MDRRDELAAYLESCGIGCRRYWHPIHTQVPYKLPDSDFPVSTSMSPRALWLASAFFMSDEDVRQVAQCIKQFYGRD
jgi:dTDP-4-amino-4,6-dideoxygalactose transaminase